VARRRLPFRQLVFNHRKAKLQFGKRLFDVRLLALQERHAFGKFVPRMDELRHAAVAVIVEIEHLPDLGEGKSHPPAAEHQGDAGAIARGIDPGLAAALGRNQPFGLIMPQRPGCDPEFLSEIANRVGPAQARSGREKEPGPHVAAWPIHYVYVNVKFFMLPT
jgi:hypothetical protein